MTLAQNLHTAWINSSALTKLDRLQLKKLSLIEIEQNFPGCVVFNKAGFRGKISLGSATFNQYTIKQIALGFIKLLQLKKLNLTKQKIIILHDTRHQSVETTNLIAKIFSHFSINVMFFPGNISAPTPFLSYLLSKGDANFGWMITSSHQMKNTNGSKIFVGKTGIANNHFIDELNEQIKLHHLNFLNKNIEPQMKKIVFGDFNSEKKLYLQMIADKLGINSKNTRKLKIVYTSLHGTGNNWTNRLLENEGYQVFSVPKQCQADPEFQTVSDPNPENPKTLALALAYAQKKKADLVIANDPDSDRMRAGIKTAKNYYLLTGNEMAIIFAYFLMNNLQKRGTIYQTVVSTNLIKKIAADYNCSVVETITGFANLTQEYIKKPYENFLFAFEESLGFLFSPHINQDKDGIQAAFFLAEIAQFLAIKNQNLFDYLQTIYQKYGFFVNKTLKFKLNSPTQISAICQFLPKLTHFGPWTVKKIENFAHLRDKNLFKIYFGSNFWIALRPSVTEPIFKFYLTATGTTKSEAEENLLKITNLAQKQFMIFFTTNLK